MATDERGITMSAKNTHLVPAVAAVVLLLAAGAWANVLDPTPESIGGINPQCPGDINGDAIPDPGAPRYDPCDEPDEPSAANPCNVCMHLAAGDGFANMGDGTVLYTFGFSDVTGVQPGQVVEVSSLAANWPAPTIVRREGERFFLSLSNVGFVMRPDLFDPHSVHFHGFPQSSSIFDGLPESAATINMGSTLTYFYNLEEPGTYLYHCHVEATEHMEMGMLGNLYVLAEQNNLPDGTPLGSYTHTTGMKYVFNDGDGSTRYHREFAVQLSAFDANFHEQHVAVQPLPFAELRSTHPMMNGRGYPDTVLDGPIANGFDGQEAQLEDSRICAQQGQRTLLRLSSVELVAESTVAIDGMPMLVVGRDATIIRSGKTGENLFYETQSVTLGGGQTVDVILDLETHAIPAGVYPLYSTNLNHLSNGGQDFGGMMTEVEVAAVCP